MDKEFSRLLIDLHQSPASAKLADMNVTIGDANGNTVTFHNTIAWKDAKRMFSGYVNERYSA